MGNINNAVIAVYCFVEDGGKYLLTHEVGKPGFKLPGGKSEENMNVYETAKKEIFEEVGLEIELGELVYIQEFIGSDHRMRLFFKARRIGGEVRTQKEEIESVEWKTIEEMSKLTENDFFHKIYYLAAQALVDNRKIDNGCFEILEQ